MKINEAGLAIVKDFEKCLLQAYLPTPDDVPTIGWGATKGVKMGDVWTQEQSDARLLEDIAESERCVNRLTGGIQITENQFSALVSLAFNIGCAAFRSSTLLVHLLNGHDDMAAEQFKRWCKQKGKTLNGLVKRRAVEEALFRS